MNYGWLNESLLSIFELEFDHGENRDLPEEIIIHILVDIINKKHNKKSRIAIEVASVATFRVS